MATSEVMETPSCSASGLPEMTLLLKDELLAAAERVLDSNWFVLGNEVANFETEFASWVGVPHAIGVASGTEALQLALMAVGVSAGDEVIVAANALPTAYGVAATGATLRFADVRECDYNLDPAHVSDLITERTKAIVAVHLYGHPAAVDELRAVVPDGVVIVEDCAQAHGAALEARGVGTLGDIAAWSFYPTKNLGAIGDAGAVTTASTPLYERVRRLRTYGEQSRYFSTEIGINSRLDELQAAFLRVKLKSLDGWIERRRAVAQRYARLLNGVVLPPAMPFVDHAYHLFPIRVTERDALLARLRDRGVQAAVHYPICSHDQPCFSHFRLTDLPVSERLARELLSLPMHPFITEIQQDFIVKELLREIES